LCLAFFCKPPKKSLILRPLQMSWKLWILKCWK